MSKLSDWFGREGEHSAADAPVRFNGYTCHNTLIKGDWPISDTLPRLDRLLVACERLEEIEADPGLTVCGKQAALEGAVVAIAGAVRALRAST